MSKCSRTNGGFVSLRRHSDTLTVYRSLGSVLALRDTLSAVSSGCRSKRGGVSIQITLWLAGVTTAAPCACVGMCHVQETARRPVCAFGKEHAVFSCYKFCFKKTKQNKTRNTRNTLRAKPREALSPPPRSPPALLPLQTQKLLLVYAKKSASLSDFFVPKK